MFVFSSTHYVISTHLTWEFLNLISYNLYVIIPSTYLFQKKLQSQQYNHLSLTSHQQYKLITYET
jgi:hypothetical protein